MSVTVRKRTKELPYRQGQSALYDEANGPRNPRGFQTLSAWDDPVGELAVLRITRADLSKCITTEPN